MATSKSTIGSNVLPLLAPVPAGVPVEPHQHKEGAKAQVGDRENITSRFRNTNELCQHDT